MVADPTNFWSSFGDDSDFVEVTQVDAGSLAVAVLNEYGISCNETIGGNLANLDIKRMDAIQVIKLSLLEATVNDNVFYELAVNEEGFVEFLPVGTSVGLSGGDVYYEIQSGTYRERCGGVMVTGGRPLAYRRPVEWAPIWQGGAKAIYDTGLMVNNCVQGDFNQQVTIVFTDPHLDDSTYENGIDNLYEITKENPYDSIMGYARYIHWEGWENSPDTVITRQNTAKILIQMPDNSLGTFFRRPEYSSDLIYDAACMDGLGETPEADTGVLVPIPIDFRYESIRDTKVDKFQGILDVCVIGLEISDIRGVPPTDVDAVNTDPETGSADVWVKMEKTYKKFWRLSKGVHYVIAYETDDDGYSQPYIVFADNSRLNDPIGIDGNNLTSFYIDPECGYADATGETEGEGYILLTSPTGGILVEEIHVSVLLDTPSIVVYDPDGWNRKANEVAETLEYLVAPLVVVEEPAPAAYNGTLIDFTSSIKDHDPTTAQDFTDTELEQIQDEMSGNGQQLTLSFLDAAQCESLSASLYDYLNSGDGTEATYVCGPDTDVTLGGTAPNGGIVNSITYSYQDSNSYTISVNAGPMIVGGLAQIDGGPSPKVMEEVSAKGTIIEDMGNHIYFKVRIDGIGERLAVNMAPTVLRVGDKVQCSVHNNPVEI